MHEPVYTNELIHESSPYLLMHAHNPVNWFPWGSKALANAEREHKPIIISIGYSSCHWCHVMERESYADTEVADFMNRYFIAVKVDREERPDIDQIYMDAVMLITGSGGWPLNAFALPDGRPFYAGTYFPKKQWLTLLNQIKHLYTTQLEELTLQAFTLTQGINNKEFINLSVDQSQSIDMKSYQSIFMQWQPLIDYESGGFTGVPKFPLPVTWEFLLQYYYITRDEKALKAVTVTLDSIAMGGICDRIGGGFARYATDKHWKVPHFEKMLYDNGQLLSLYAHAYQLTDRSLYAEIISETLNFVKNEMTHPLGGFYSSINADSEGTEGAFYVWTNQDMETLLGKDVFNILAAYYQLMPSGNWENGTNIIYTKEPAEEFAYKQGMTPASFRNLLADASEKIRNARNKRVRPSTDDKILTSWNALMMKGCIDAYRALGKEEYLTMALQNARFIEQWMIGAQHGLMRNFKDGSVSIPGFLDDYAFLIDVFIELYQVTFSIHWLEQAKALTDHTVKYFYSRDHQLFYYTSAQSEHLIARTMEITDQVTPSSNSVMAKNLYRLGVFFDSQNDRAMSINMLNKVRDETIHGGPYYANWANFLGMHLTILFEIAIVGEEALTRNLEMQRSFLPTSLFMGGDMENLPLLTSKKISGRTSIYVCRNRTCSLPVVNVDAALKQIESGLR